MVETRSAEDPGLTRVVGCLLVPGPGPRAACERLAGLSVRERTVIIALIGDGPAKVPCEAAVLITSEN